MATRPSSPAVDGHTSLKSQADSGLPTLLLTTLGAEMKRGSCGFGWEVEAKANPS